MALFKNTPFRIAEKFGYSSDISTAQVMFTTKLFVHEIHLKIYIQIHATWLLHF